jgi:hypothetical protein
MSKFPARELIPPPPPLPWGRLVDEGRLAAVVRFVTPQQTASWPVHGLIRWVWTSGETESLVIYASGATITITGRKLEPIRDALDSGRLQQVQVMTERGGATATGPFIRGITIAAL